MSKRDNVIAKIRGLWNHAQDRTDVEEQNAFLLAQRLMAQYEVDISEIEDGNAKNERIVSKPANVFHVERRYEGALANVIAENFRVETYWSTSGNSKRVMFYGYESDVDLAIEIFNIAFQITGERTKAYIDLWYKTPQYIESIGEKVILSRNRKLTNRLKGSYGMGFVWGLEKTLKNQRETNLSDELALAVVVPPEVHDSYNEKVANNFVENDEKKQDKLLTNSLYDGVDDGLGINLTAKALGDGQNE